MRILAIHKNGKLLRCRYRFSEDYDEKNEEVIDNIVKEVIDIVSSFSCLQDFVSFIYMPDVEAARLRYFKTLMLLRALYAYFCNGGGEHISD
jgi:hypothetical protein